MSRGITKDGEAWRLAFREGVVTQLQIDFAFGFTVDAEVDFRIEVPFEAGDTGGWRAYDPEVPGAVGPLAVLHQAVVHGALVMTDGRLEVSFTNGSSLRVLPNNKYEAFSVTGPAGSFRFVSLPGGGLAEWLPEQH